MSFLDTAVIVLYLLGLDRLQFAGKPHLLLYGFLGMIACLIVAPIASALRGVGK